MATNSSSAPAPLVVKEGFLNKKGCVLKSWSSKYFMLNKHSLVYYHHKEQLPREGSLKSGLSPQGRIFLSDVITIESESDVGDKKACEFILHTKKHGVKLQASSQAERNAWVDAINFHRTLEAEGEVNLSEEDTLESEGDSQAKNLSRRSLRKLPPGLKRVTLSKDPVKGIGCTIKSAAGHIFVDSIIEDGPIAFTGVLRPDDELLDVQGVALAGMSVAQVGAVIHNCPEEFLAVIRPVSAPKKQHWHPTTNIQRVNYATKTAAFSPPTPPTSTPAFSHSLPTPHTGPSTVDQEPSPDFGVQLSSIHMAYSYGSSGHDDMVDYDEEEEDQPETLTISS